MSDNIEYEFKLANEDFFAFRRTYGDAGPDAVGPLLRTECFVNDEWTVAAVRPMCRISIGEDVQAVTQAAIARCMSVR